MEHVMSDDKPTNDKQVELNEFDRSRRTDLTAEQSRKWDAMDATFEAFLEADLIGLNRGAHVTAGYPNELAFFEYVGQLAALLPSNLTLKWGHHGNSRSVSLLSGTRGSQTEYHVTLAAGQPTEPPHNLQWWDTDKMIVSGVGDLYPPPPRVAELMLAVLAAELATDPVRPVVFLPFSSYEKFGIKL